MARLNRDMTGRRRGFSLLELLVVLVVIGIFAGIAGPVAGRLSGSMSFRKQVGDITAVLRLARLSAIGRGRAVRVSLDEAGDEFVFHLAGGIDAARPVGSVEAIRVDVDPAVLIFFPEGHATPGTVSVASGERKALVRIDPLTGVALVE